MDYEPNEGTVDVSVPGSGTRLLRVFGLAPKMTFMITCRNTESGLAVQDSVNFGCGSFRPVSVDSDDEGLLQVQIPVGKSVSIHCESKS